MIRPVAIGFFLALGSLLACTSAEAGKLPAQGGPGGGQFNGACPQGQFLRGVSARVGAWIVAIASLCATFDASTGKFNAWKRGKRFGGTGASPLLKDIACPPDRFVDRIQFGWTRDEGSYVDYVQLRCVPMTSGQSNFVCLQSGDGCWSKHPNPPPKGIPLPGGGLNIIGDSPFEQSCPIGEAVTGIHGSSGAFIDALGLICGPEPKRVLAAPAPPAPPQSPAKPETPDPPAPPVEVGDASKPRANFSGTWNSVAGKDATKLTLSLGQQGTLVKGSYQPYDGRISGRVNGNQLIFNWAQGGRANRHRTVRDARSREQDVQGRVFRQGVQGPPSYWGGARQ